MERAMQAMEVMHRDLVTVSPNDTVDRTVRLMLEHQVSGLPVVDETGKLIGIVTEGDLLHRVENDTDRSLPLWRRIFASREQLAAEFVKSTGRRVKDVMTPDVVTVPETALLAEIAELFDRKRIKRVPVLYDGKLVGIVTRADRLWRRSRRRYADGRIPVIHYPPSRTARMIAPAHQCGCGFRDHCFGLDPVELRKTFNGNFIVFTA
jgi:CBS domain-containing protein